jgi:hypothetical protein
VTLSSQSGGHLARSIRRGPFSSWGGRRTLPLAFTEHGAVQAATILNSSCAVEISVYVVRAFVKLREVLSTNRELARRFEQLESRINDKLTKHDEAIAAILSAIRELMKPPEWRSPWVGLHAGSGSRCSLIEINQLRADSRWKIHTRLDGLELRIIANWIKAPVYLQQLEGWVAQLLGLR